MNIGIDIGGSHIGIGVVSKDGKIKKKEEIFISGYKGNDKRQFIEDSIISTLKSWNEDDSILPDKIGIGVPGVVVNDEIMYCVNLEIGRYDLKSKIKSFFPEADIHIKNDAKWAGLAEKRLGALKKFEDCIFICIGTGIGGAVFYNGELVSPKRSSGFEFGHTILKPNGEPCKCGSRGCFERYGSMRYFKKQIKNALNLDSSVEGEKLRNILRENLNNEVVDSIINEYIQNLCIGFSNIINILEPQAICIGGGFVKYKDILLNKLIEELSKSKYIFYKDSMPQILTAELGNDAGIIGSALFE